MTSGPPVIHPRSLAERLAWVQADIADAARAAGREPDSVTTIVVTKFQPVAMVRELAALGVVDFGESRHQEAQAKAAQLRDLDLCWHFIGQLQSKKARQVSAYARVIHSVDRDSLIDALTLTAQDSPGPATGCFIQLNLTEDEHRGGVSDRDLERIAERVAAAPNLRLLGVMAVAPLDAAPEQAFSRLRLASERVQRIDPDARFISAGMSGDYRHAIAQGATHLRIGSAITGNRLVRD